MQAFCCEVVRALMKLGIAIAANRPIMATTIMISTNVKPDLREVLIFILCIVFLFCGVNEATSGSLMSSIFVHTLPVAATEGIEQPGCQTWAPRQCSRRGREADFVRLPCAERAPISSCLTARRAHSRQGQALFGRSACLRRFGWNNCRRSLCRRRGRL